MIRLRRKWVALFLVPGGVLLAVACSDDEQPSPPSTVVPTIDGGPNPQFKPPPNDSSDTDTNTPPVDAGPGTGLVALHNTMVTNPLRFCFLGSATNPDPQPTDVIGGAAQAQPATGDGMPPGTMADLVVPNLTGLHVKAVAFYGDTLTAFALNNKTCAEIFAVSLFRDRPPPASDAGVDAGDAGDDGGDAGDGGTGVDAGGKLLIEGLDFERSTIVIPNTVFNQQSKFLLFATGCTRIIKPQFAPLTACGSAESGRGDFSVFAFELDKTAAVAGKVRAQFLNGSTQLARRGFPNATMTITYGDAGQQEQIMGPEDGGFDGGAASVANPTQSGKLSPAPGTELTVFDDAQNAVARTPFGLINRTYDSVLAVSNMQKGDVKATKSYTIILAGSSAYAPATFPDGGPNPANVQIRIIPND